LSEPKGLSMNNPNILAALAGALPRCRPFAGNGHAARPAPCIASRQHTHKRYVRINSHLQVTRNALIRNDLIRKQRNQG